MVENGKFLNRLRNVHLEKSAVRGLMPFTFTQRLRKRLARCTLDCGFKALGKPRTAGLCGQSGAAACGHLLYLVLKSNGLRHSKKPSCKVRLFVPKRSMHYRQKVTVTTLFQTAFHRAFQLLATNGPRLLSQAKASTHSPSPKDRTQRLTRRNRGRFGWGWYHYPRSVPHVPKPCVAGCQNGKLCRF